MKLRKTLKGDYTGWHKGYYVDFFRRPHGCWACLIRKKWLAVAGNGYFATSLRTIKDAKKWASDAIIAMQSKPPQL